VRRWSRRQEQAARAKPVREPPVEGQEPPERHSVGPRHPRQQHTSQPEVVPDAGQGVNTMVDSKVVVNCASDKLANAPRCGPVIVTGNLATARCGVFDVVSRRQLSTVTTCVYPHRLRSVDK